MVARITSLKFENTNCCGVLKPYLTVDAKLSYPSWKPRLLGPFSLKDFHSYFLRQSTTCYPNVGLSLHFYYPDLGPSNIMVLEEGNVEEILDWEFAWFYLQYKIALKLMRNADFYLKSTEEIKREA